MSLLSLPKHTDVSAGAIIKEVPDLPHHPGHFRCITKRHNAITTTSKMNKSTLELTHIKSILNLLHDVPFSVTFLPDSHTCSHLLTTQDKGPKPAQGTRGCPPRAGSPTATGENGHTNRAEGRGPAWEARGWSPAVTKDGVLTHSPK